MCCIFHASKQRTLLFPAMYNTRELQFLSSMHFHKVRGIKILTLNQSHTNINKAQNAYDPVYHYDSDEIS